MDSGGCGGEIAKIDSNGCSGEIEKIDSGGCVKRKAPEIDDSGGEIAKIDGSGGEIPKIDDSDERKTKKVERFTDKSGLMDFYYKQKMSYECEGFDPLKAYGPHNPFKEGTSFHGMDDYSSSDEDDDDETKARRNKEKAEKPPFDTTDLVKYITQVRNSYGFDVDVRFPPWLLKLCMLYLVPLDLSHHSDYDYANGGAKVAIDDINVDMEIETQKSKTYELVEVAKAVYVYHPYCLLFLTLTVKKVEEEEEEEAATTTIQALMHQPMLKPFELQQWRFKPGAAEA